MRVITRGVISWETGEVVEQDSYEYSGPIAECKSSGSAPQPTDPYEQAAAQYGLSTGTADYNAALERTGVANPLGRSNWVQTGVDGSGQSSFGGYPTGFGSQNEGSYYGYAAPALSTGAAAGTSGLSTFGLGTQPGYNSYGDPISTTPTSTSSGRSSAAGAPYGLGGSSGGTGAPLYTQETSLDPWANKLLSSPIDTSQIPGMPGGPSEQQNVNSAEQATYGQEMQLLAPQEREQSEQTQAQLEAEGAVPGSAAYAYGEQQLGLQQGAENTAAANQAVTTGMGELPMLYGLGSTSLQNQLAERSAPISEFEALQGNGGGNVSAATPDISGAFNQQYQGQLAGYNAGVATNNATDSTLGMVAAAAAIYF